MHHFQYGVIVFTIAAIVAAEIIAQGVKSHRDLLVSRSLAGSFASGGHVPSPDMDTTIIALVKRVHHLQIQHVEIHSFTVPVCRAALALSAFYYRILHESVSSWSALPPHETLRITNGFFALCLMSLNGPVPWTLLAEIAENMLSMTGMGFTGTYDIWYGDPMFNGIGRVLVQFRVGREVGVDGSVIVDSPFQELPF